MNPLCPAVCYTGSWFFGVSEESENGTGFQITSFKKAKREKNTRKAEVVPHGVCAIGWDSIYIFLCIPGTYCFSGVLCNFACMFNLNLEVFWKWEEMGKKVQLKVYLTLWKGYGSLTTTPNEITIKVVQLQWFRSVSFLRFDLTFLPHDAKLLFSGFSLQLILTCFVRDSRCVCFFF